MMYKEIIDRISDLYVSYRGRYIVAVDGRVFIPHDAKTKQPKALTHKTLLAHMNRRFAIGVFAGSHSSKFICFDVDLDDPAIVHRLIDGIEEFGFPRDRVYVSSSGNKGYHVELFFDGLMYTNVLQDFYRAIIVRLGLDPRKVEFRPTRGQAIKLPLSVHHKTGRVCWYLDRETLEPIESADYVLSIKTLDRDAAVKHIQERVKDPIYIPEKPEKPERPERMSSYERIEGDALPTLTAPGRRNSLMVSIGVHLRYLGVPQEEIEARLMEWVSKQNKAFILDPPKIVALDASNIAAWVWSDKFFTLRRGAYTITNIDKTKILAQRTKVMRRILFLIFLFSSKYGLARMRIPRIAEFVSCTPRSAITAIGSLEEVGAIAVTKGKRYRVGETIASACNTYKYLAPSGDPSETTEFVWDYAPESFMDISRQIFGDRAERLWSKHEMEEMNHGNQ